MAGKRQHYVPQFLQRGFTIEGKEKQTWVTRLGKQPYLSGIQNTGVEGYFYTEGNDLLLDEEITQEEYKLDAIINKLREYSDGKTVSSDLAAKLIAHFEIRTRHLRINFFQTFNNIIQQISKVLENEEVFLQYLRKKIIKDVHFVEEQINSLPSIPKSQKKLWVQIIQKNPDLIIQQLFNGPLLKFMAMEMRKQFSREIVIHKVKEAHIKALKQTIMPEAKIAIFSKLKFKIIKVSDTLFLGDSIVVFVDVQDKCKPFYEQADKLKSIIVPLDQYTYLLGFEAEEISYTTKRLREMIASCSLEFFISPEEKIASQYNGIIGKNADILSKEQAAELLLDVLNE